MTATAKLSGESAALERFSEMMIEKIESINSDWKKPWFTNTSGAWPTNLAGRNYNGMNTFMLMLLCEQKGYRIPVFATFNSFAALNFTGEGDKKKRATKDGVELPFVKVNQGEKMFPVYYTSFSVFNKETDEKISYEDYMKLSSDERLNYNVFPRQHIYYVLNVDQTNLKESRPEIYEALSKKYIKEEVKPDESKMFCFPEMDDLIANQNWVCPIKTVQGDECYYSVSRDEIVLPLKSQFKDGESFYGNAFHEMAHSTGHKDRRNRLVQSSFGSKEYAREELVAEMTAALVCMSYGIEKHIKDDSCAYLKSWLESLKEEPAFIKTVLTDVKKASADIIERVKTIE